MTGNSSKHGKGVMIPHGAPDVEFAAFIDTNIFSSLLKTEDPAQRVIISRITEIERRYVPAVNVITSPFALYEYAGIPVLRPPTRSLPKKLWGTEETIELFFQNLRTALAFYRIPENINLDQLRHRTKDKFRFVNASAKPLLATLVQHFLSEDRLDYIALLLAWDFACAADYPKETRIELLQFLLRSWDFHHADGTNKPFLRIVSAMAIEMIDSFEKSNARNQQSEIGRVAHTLKFKKDFVDTELIHFALMGWHYRPGNIKRVHCFTGDPVEKIEEKINFFSLMYGCYHKDTFLNEDQEEVPSIDAIPGYIHCLDSRSLRTIKTIKAQDVLVRCSTLWNE